MYEIIGIPARRINTFWKYAEKYVEKALEHAHGEMSSDGIRQRCAENYMQLWLVVKDEKIPVGAYTTEINVGEDSRVVRGVTIAGDDFSEWIVAVDEALDDWARQCNCEAIDLAGRPGWERKIKHLGYKKTYTIFRKEVPNDATIQHSGNDTALDGRNRGSADAAADDAATAGRGGRSAPGNGAQHGAAALAGNAADATDTDATGDATTASAEPVADDDAEKPVSADGIKHDASRTVWDAGSRRRLH